MDGLRRSCSFGVGEFLSTGFWILIVSVRVMTIGVTFTSTFLAVEGLSIVLKYTVFSSGFSIIIPLRFPNREGTPKLSLYLFIKNKTLPSSQYSLLVGSLLVFIFNLTLIIKIKTIVTLLIKHLQKSGIRFP